jgi:hypothetical protein
MLLAASGASSEAPRPYEVAYLTSGPTEWQPSFEANCEHVV